MGWIVPELVQDDVFEVSPVSSPPTWGQGYEAELKKASDLSPEDLLEIRTLQGRFATAYLRTVYRSRKTHVLLIRRGRGLAGVLWVVPGRIMRRRYAFVPRDAFAIISCATAVDHRGRGLYPRGIEQIAASGLASRYLIWAHDANFASLRGIRKAGGVMVGQFTRKRWLRGLVARIEYRKYDE